MKNRMIAEIVTNENCNLRCSYCFARKKNNTDFMDDTTIDNTLLFIAKEFKDGKFEFLDFKVYGGESMIYPNVLEKIIKKYIDFINYNQITASFILITNGTIYNKNIFKKVQDISKKTKNLSSSRVTFTLDAYKENHDKFRVYADGSGSFDTIVSNIKKFKEELPDFRFNIQFVFTENVFKNIDKLFEFEKESGLILNDLISTDISYSGVTDNEIEYAIDLMYKNHKHGGGSAYRLGLNIPSPICSRTNYCGFGYSYLCVIHNGDIYPCSKAYHNNLNFMKMGNVNEYNGILKNREFYKNMTISKKCINCSEGSNCLGYCYIDNLLDRGDSDKIDDNLCRVNKIYSKVHRKYFPLIKSK